MELLVPDYGLIVFSAITLLFLFAWIVALIDILKSNFTGPNDKWMWILLVSMIPFIGVILYFFMGRKHKIKINQL